MSRATRPMHESRRARSIAGAAGLALLASVGVAAPAFAAADLVLVPDVVTSAILILVFVILIGPLNALVFKPLLKVMDEREERIAGAHRRADQLQKEAEEVLERYRASIQSAHDEANADRRSRVEAARGEQGSITGTAKDEAEAQVVRAREELSSSLDEARQSLRDGSDALARLAAERILGRALS